MREGRSLQPPMVYCGLVIAALRVANLPRWGAAVLRPYKDIANRCASRSGESVPCFALLARRFKFVVGLPTGQRGLRSRFASERETESRHLGKPCEIPVGVILVARLMIMMVDVIFSLGLAPRGVVAFVFLPFVNRERRHANTRETEMIRAIVMPRFRARVGTNRQTELLRGPFHHGINVVRSAPLTSTSSGSPMGAS